MVCRTAPISMTLNDAKPRFQGQAIFDAEYLRNGQRYGHSYYMEGKYETVPKLSNGTTFNDLE